MNTLVIYDESGFVISESTSTLEQRIPIGIPYLLVDIPFGKRIKRGIGVDVSVTPHQVILEDIPPTETEVLRENVAGLNQQLLDVYEILLLGGL